MIISHAVPRINLKSRVHSQLLQTGNTIRKSGHFRANEENEKGEKNEIAHALARSFSSRTCLPARVTAVQFSTTSSSLNIQRGSTMLDLLVQVHRRASSATLVRTRRGPWTRATPCPSLYSSTMGVDRCACPRTRRDAAQTLLECKLNNYS